MVAPLVAAGTRVVAGTNTRQKTGAAFGQAVVSHKPTYGGHYRINMLMLVLMIMVALVIEMVQVFLNLTVLLAIGGLYVSFLGMTIFAIWFKILGVTFVGGRAGLKIISLGTAAVIELVPFLNALPSFTLGVLIIALISRMEDRSNQPA